MAALSAQRRVTPSIGGFAITLQAPVKGNVKLYKGALVAADATGNLVPAAATAGLRVAGVHDAGTNHSVTDTTASGPAGLLADGAISGNYQLGIWPFLNSGTDPVTQADLFNDVFMVDDQTVARSDGGVGRAIVGQLIRIDTSPAQVFVSIGLRIGGRAGGPGENAYVAPDTISASGAISLATRATLVSVTGTTAYTLAAGLYLGQRKRFRCTVAASTPHGVITPAAATGYTSVELNAVGQTVDLEWNGAGWSLVGTAGTPTVV